MKVEIRNLGREAVALSFSKPYRVNLNGEGVVSAKSVVIPHKQSLTSEDREIVDEFMVKDLVLTRRISAIIHESKPLAKADKSVSKASLSKPDKGLESKQQEKDKDKDQKKVDEKDTKSLI